MTEAASTEAAVVDSAPAGEASESVESSATSEVSESEGVSTDVDSAELSEGAKEGLEEAIESAEEAEATDSADEGQLYSVKIDGVEYQLTLDQMKQSVSMGKAAQDRFQEAARMKKEAEALVEKNRRNPIEAAKELGIETSELRAMAEEFLLEQLKYDDMSDEQKEYMRIQKENEEYKKREEEAKSAKEEESRRQETEYHQQNYMKEMEAAFDSLGMDLNPTTVQGVANKIMEHDLDISVEMAASQYQKEQEMAVQAYLNKLNEDQISKVVGSDRMKKIRQKEVASLKNPTKSIKQEASSEPVELPETKSMSAFFDT